MYFNKTFFKTLIAFICYFSFFTAPHGFALTFSQRFDIAKNSNSYFIADNIREILKSRRILFISGFLNEVGSKLSAYFGTSMRVTQELGIMTSIINPPSLGSIENNSNLLLEYIHSYYLEDPTRPLILIAHSKGGIEALYTVLRYPKLLTKDWIDRVVILQAPLGGTPFADPGSYSYGLGWMAKTLQRRRHLEPLPKDMKRFFRKVCHQYRKSIHAQPLSRKKKQRMEEISEKVFYVRTATPPERMGWTVWFLQKITGINKAHLGESDGIIPTSEQKLQGCKNFGRDLGVIESDHVGITNGWMGNLSHPEVNAFTYALLEEIYSD